MPEKPIKTKLNTICPKCYSKNIGLKKLFDRIVKQCQICKYIWSNSE